MNLLNRIAPALLLAFAVTVAWKLRSSDTEKSERPELKAPVARAVASSALSASASAPASSPTAPPVSTPPSDASRAKDSTPRKSFSLEDFAREFPGRWETANSPDGTVRTLAGGEVRLREGDTLGSLELARQMAQHFGVAASEIGAAPNSQTQTLSRTAFRFTQMHEGRVVFQGTMDFFAVNGTGLVTLVNNDLRPIDVTLPGPALSAREAQASFENSGGEKRQVLTIEGPLYFVEARRATPAYLAVIKRESARTEEQVVIDGNSGKALFQQPLTTD